MDDAGERLRQERAVLGLNQQEFGKLGGVAKNTQANYESGATPIPLDYLSRLQAHGVDIIYVVSGTRIGTPATMPQALGDRRTDFRHPAADRQAPEEMVSLAEVDLRFGLGAAYMDEEVLEHSALRRLFPRDWIRQITSSPPSRLCWAQGQGNSMEPTIGDGDIILIDRSQITPGFGDLYWAISYGQTGMIKRLRPMPDGSVKILSDNPSVPPETAYDGELNVFGRVVAVVKRI